MNMAKLCFHRRIFFLVSCFFVSTNQIYGKSLEHQFQKSNFLIHIELFDPGPLSPTHTTTFIGNDGGHTLRFSGPNLTSVFPCSTSEPSLIVTLHREPFQNSRLADQLDFDIFTINEDGAQMRVNEHANSFISFFHGRLLPQLTNSCMNGNNSEVFAIGYIDKQTRFVWLQAFVRIESDFLYIRPQIRNFKPTSNLHFVTRESGHFFNLFRISFILNTFPQRRLKRSLDHVENSCPIILFIDYSLFEAMNHEYHRTIRFAHSVFTFANNIFQSTKFTKTGYSSGYEDIENEGTFEGFHHTLCKIIVQTEPAKMMDSLYNHDRAYWPYDHLKNVLSNLPHRESYCLAFLLTNMSIVGTDSDINGFAMESSIFSARKSVPNVGVASFHNCPDPLDLYCTMNFAHELGHAWGAPHDAHSTECIPSTGGTYLMSTPFLFTKGPNNMLFSPCSIRAIYFHLQSIGQQEFHSFCAKCGNGRIEDPEECDEGIHAGQCCTDSCTLLGEAKCSHFNHDCCSDQCQVVTKSALCRQFDLVYCLEESRCDGTHLHCPQPRKMADGSKCALGGICVSGYCNATCPADQVSCECPELADQCFSCCQGNSHLKNQEWKPCAPAIPLPSGTPCSLNDTLIGRCLAGYCEESTSDFTPEEPTNTPDRYYLYALPIILIFSVLVIASYCARKKLAQYFNRRLSVSFTKEGSFEAQLVEAELNKLEPSTSHPNGHRQNGSSNS